MHPGVEDSFIDQMAIGKLLLCDHRRQVAAGSLEGLVAEIIAVSYIFLKIKSCMKPSLIPFADDFTSCFHLFIIYGVSKIP